MTGPIEGLPPDAPATVEDVRATRRWTWVAFAWAIAASAIAVIALVSANNNDNSQPTRTTPDLTGQVRQFESQTNDRLDQFSRRLNGRAAQSDIQKLDKRLSQVEDAQSKSDTSETTQSNDIKQLQTDVKDLQDRMDKVEQQQSQSQNGNTTP